MKIHLVNQKKSSLRCHLNWILPIFICSAPCQVLSLVLVLGPGEAWEGLVPALEHSAVHGCTSEPQRAPPVGDAFSEAGRKQTIGSIFLKLAVCGRQGVKDLCFFSPIGEALLPR